MSEGLLGSIVLPVEPTIHPADLFLRGASESQGAVQKFFDEELAPKMREMVERRFPAHG